MNRFCTIKGLSAEERLPVIEKISLGEKVPGPNGKPIPREFAYFGVSARLGETTGQKPTELRVTFASDDSRTDFPHRLEMYGASAGLKCLGDGDHARRKNGAGVWENLACPCSFLDKKECRPTANLFFMIPEASMGALFQITIHSRDSIVAINSELRLVKQMIGRISWLPFILRRVAREYHRNGRRETHYPLQLILAATAADLKAIAENKVPFLVAPANALPAADSSDRSFQNAPADPHPTQEGAAMEQKFRSVIPEGTDRERLNKFMEALGYHYKQNSSEVMETAIAAPDQFFRTFQVWRKKHFGDEVQCPDKGKISASACTGCATRQGCPGWD